MVRYFMSVGMLPAWPRMSTRRLRTIAQEEGAMNEEDSGVWVKGLQKERRYLKDVY